MATNTLSDRQLAILNCIRDHIAQKHYPPTLREIIAVTDITTTSIVNYNLNRLEQAGYIARDPGVARGIRLTEQQRQGGC